MGGLINKMKREKNKIKIKLYYNIMPYEIKKLPNSHLYQMINKHTGMVVAKRTTLQKAEAQKRLLDGIHAESVKQPKK